MRRKSNQPRRFLKRKHGMESKAQEEELTWRRQRGGGRKAPRWVSRVSANLEEGGR